MAPAARRARRRLRRPPATRRVCGGSGRAGGGDAVNLVGMEGVHHLGGVGVVVRVDPVSARRVRRAPVGQVVPLVVYPEVEPALALLARARRRLCSCGRRRRRRDLRERRGGEAERLRRGRLQQPRPLQQSAAAGDQKRREGHLCLCSRSARFLCLHGVFVLILFSDFFSVRGFIAFLQLPPFVLLLSSRLADNGAPPLRRTQVLVPREHPRRAAAGDFRRRVCKARRLRGRGARPAAPAASRG